MKTLLISGLAAIALGVSYFIATKGNLPQLPAKPTIDPNIKAQMELFEKEKQSALEGL